MSVKVSVIMGVYNPASKEQLMQAVYSIKHQSMQDWEVIICDDGSEPEKSRWISEAAQIDGKIQIIHNKENHGLGYSLNQCLTYAKGIYIARMDADDISYPSRLERQALFLNEHSQYQWVGSNSKLFDERGIWGTDLRPEIPKANDFLHFSPYIHPSVMFRREVLEQCGGYSDEELTRRCEDYELFMRLHAMGYRGFNIQDVLFQYREDKDNFTRRSFLNRVREMKVRYKGFKRLGILKPGTLRHVVRPVLAGVLSPSMIRYIKKHMRKNNRDIRQWEQGRELLDATAEE